MCPGAQKLSPRSKSFARGKKTKSTLIANVEYFVKQIFLLRLLGMRWLYNHLSAYARSWQKKKENELRCVLVMNMDISVSSGHHILYIFLHVFWINIHKKNEFDIQSFDMPARDYHEFLL